jgi:hypothetical protein
MQHLPLLSTSDSSVNFILTDVRGGCPYSIKAFAPGASAVVAATIDRRFGIEGKAHAERVAAATPYLSASKCVVNFDVAKQALRATAVSLRRYGARYGKH